MAHIPLIDDRSSPIEERRQRDKFSSEHGEHLPEDLCLSIQNPPTRWEVVPWNHESVESLPEIEDDLLREVKQNC